MVLQPASSGHPYFAGIAFQGKDKRHRKAARPGPDGHSGQGCGRVRSEADPHFSPISVPAPILASQMTNRSSKGLGILLGWQAELFLNLKVVEVMPGWTLAG